MDLESLTHSQIQTLKQLTTSQLNLLKFLEERKHIKVFRDYLLRASKSQLRRTGTGFEQDIDRLVEIKLIEIDYNFDYEIEDYGDPNYDEFKITNEGLKFLQILKEIS